MSKVSKSIKKFRMAKGLTQAELADKLFVTRQTVSSWENGRTQPDIDSLEKLAQALTISIEELIYGEKPKTVDDGKNEKARKNMIIIFSIIASLLVGIGGILVFVNYWESFPVIIKTVFSVIPMLLGQIAGVFVFAKKYNKAEWREGAAVLWCAGIAATVALCDSVLNLSTDFSACALIDIILFLPVIYILDAVSPLIVYYGLSVYYGFAFYDIYSSVRYSDSILDCAALPLLLVLLLSGALYVFLHRKEKEDARHIYSVWITVLAFTAFAVFAGILSEDFFFTAFIAVMMLMYALKDKGCLSVPCKTLMPLAFSVSSVFLTSELRPNERIEYLNDIELSTLIIIAVSIVTAIVAFIILMKRHKGDILRLIYCVCVAAAFTASVICIRTSLRGKLLVFIAVYIIAMSQGALLIILGAKESRFLPLNIGLLTVIALICEILFSQDLNFLIVGMVMIFFGICLFVVNYRLARSVRIEKKGAVINE